MLRLVTLLCLALLVFAAPARAQVPVEMGPSAEAPEPSAAPAESARPTPTAPVPAPSGSADRPAAPALLDEPAEVRVGETVAFVIRVKAGDQSAADRALAAQRALRDAFDAASPEDVRVERSAAAAIVYVGQAPVVQLFPPDAAAAGAASLEVHADAVAADVRRAIQVEKQRTALASRIFAICLVVFLAVAVIYLWRKIGDFAERGNAWLEDNPHRIPEVRVRSLTLLNPAAFRSGIALAISVAKWVGQLALVYLWLITGMSLFPSTRPYTDRLNAIILQPFVELASRVAGSLPITVVVAIAVLTVAIVFRVVGLFFESVREGTTELEWLPPELARPTSILVRGGLVLVTLIFAAPVLTGHPDGALARAGLVGLITIGLASTPLVACSVVGLVVVFGRRLRAGDHVAIGAHEGKVMDVGLFDVTLEDEKGHEIRVPHLVSLVRATRIIGSAPRVAVRLAIPRDRARTSIREKLLLAIAPAGLDPRVEIDAISGDDVVFSLSVVTEDLDAKSRLFLLALETLEGSPLDAPVEGAPGPAPELRR